MAGVFHKADDAAGVRFGAAFRRGVTLVELMISMLLLAIICVAWFKIIAVQSARKEARRREAVERLSGMMDAFMYCKRQTNPSFIQPGDYRMEIDEGILSFTKNSGLNVVNPVFAADVSPVGYRLSVTNAPGWPSYDAATWGSGPWLVGRLYENNGTEAESGRAFFTLPVYLGRK